LEEYPSGKVSGRQLLSFTLSWGGGGKGLWEVGDDDDDDDDVSLMMTG